MNCTHCGKKLIPEAPFCPHCGGTNELREQLENNVSAFDAGYDAATFHVRSVVSRKNRFIAKLVVAVFFALLLAATILLQDVLSYTVAYDIRVDRMRKNLTGLLTEENAYLDAQDYFGLNAWFANGHEVSDLNTVAPSYRLVNTTVRNYCEAMLELMAYQNELAAKKTYHETLVSRARGVRSDLDSYYDGIKLARQGGEDHAREDAVKQMNRNLEAALVALFGMPTEEAASLSTLTRGARGVLLETYIQAPPQPEENTIQGLGGETP